MRRLGCPGHRRSSAWLSALLAFGCSCSNSNELHDTARDAQGGVSGNTIDHDTRTGGASGIAADSGSDASSAGNDGATAGNGGNGAAGSDAAEGSSGTP